MSPATPPPKVEQAHGGAIYQGGLPGNRGGRGRLPSAFRELARECMEDLVPRLHQMGRGDPMPASIVVGGAVVEVQMRPSFSDQRAAAEAITKLGMGSVLSRDDLVDRLRRQTEVLKSMLPEGEFQAVMRRLSEVWRE